MKDQKFQAGDVVKLASGGPAMVAVGFAPASGSAPQGWIACKWITESSQLPQLDYFPPEALVRVPSPGS